MPDYQKIIKLDKEGAFAKKIRNKYICLYYKSNNKDSIYAKYSDLGSNQYNYEKKRHYPEDNSKYSGCEVSYEVYKDYEIQAYINETSFMTTIPSKCDYLYLMDKANGFGNKYLFDMWKTTLIFTCFISFCSIGLAIVGFLLFKNSDDSEI